MVEWILKKVSTPVMDAVEFEELIYYLEETGTKFKIVNNFDDLTKLNFSKPVFYYGGTDFIEKIYNSNLNKIGVFYNSDFNMRNFIRQYKRLILNQSCIILNSNKISELRSDSVFIRPVSALKKFESRIYLRSEFDQIPDNTEILISSVKWIKKEWRVFIIGGKIVSISLYKKEFELCETVFDVPESLFQFVKVCLLIYSVSNAFVMDVGLVEDDYYIIEINLINSACFYMCSKGKIVQQINKLIKSCMV